MSHDQKLQTRGVFEFGSSYVGLALMRIIAGFMMLRYAEPRIREYYSKGTYTNRFYDSYVDWLVLPEWAYALLLGVIVTSALFIILGFHTRTALTVGCLSVATHLHLCEFWYRHNRYFLILVLLILIFSPCSRALAIDSMARARGALQHGRIIAGSLFLRIQLSIIYLSSSGGKLLDGDWVSGRMLHDRMLGTQSTSQAGELFSGSLLWTVLALVAISQELFLAIAPWFRRLRHFAMWFCVIFHGYIEWRYPVATFSYLSLGVYFVMVTPETGNRIVHYNPAIQKHRLLAMWVAILDWFDKIKLVKTEDEYLMIEWVDGKKYYAGMALAMTLAAMPLTFVVAFPVTLARFLGIGKSVPARIPKEGLIIASALNWISFASAVVIGAALFVLAITDVGLRWFQPRFLYGIVIVPVLMVAGIGRNLLNQNRSEPPA